MNRLELEEQLQDLVDGKLAREEKQALLARIKEDPEHLDLYLDYAELECAFQRMTSSQAALREEQTIITQDFQRRLQRRNWRLTLLGAAAIVALLAVVLKLTLVADPPPMLAFRTSPETVLTVSHLSVGTNEPKPGTLVEGSQAVLTQGSVELAFGTGVRAIVQGPADLTLLAEDQLFLREGVAWFKVPPEAVGFRVQTPELTVVDLGTEFGVRSRPGLFDEVHVFKGNVEVQSRSGFAASETLSSGSARSAARLGRLAKIDPQPAYFLTTLPATLPHLHWTFDEDNPAQAGATGSHPAANQKMGELVVQGGGSTGFHSVPGRFGKSLYTPGEIAVAETSWPGIMGNAPRTIAHWIKVAPEQTGTQPIVGWGSHDLRPFNWNPAFLTYLRTRGPDTVLGVSFGSYYLDATTAVNDGEWHHFAVVYTGRTRPDGEPELTCYLDGKPEPMLRTSGLERYADSGGKVEIDTTTNPSRALPVTLFAQGWSSPPRPANFDMALDELFIFEAALDAGQIHNLYRFNRYDP